MSTFGKMVLAAGSKLSIRSVMSSSVEHETLLCHFEVHRSANLKLGSSQHHGSPLTNGFGHHGSKAGR